MSDLKMSDVFNLPMICEDGDGFLCSNDMRYAIEFDDTDVNCFEQKSLVAHAINSHDQLTADLAEAKAEIKRLREFETAFRAVRFEIETLNKHGKMQAHTYNAFKQLLEKPMTDIDSGKFKLVE